MATLLPRAYLNEQVYETLRRRLLAREHGPGEKLSLHELAAELGVSRSPVHHALTRLVSEGMLTVKARRGYFVTPVTRSALLEGDLLSALAAAAAGELAGTQLGSSRGAAVTVVLAAGNYPAGVDRGSALTGVAECEATGALVFHAGTAMHGERLVTNGGRILGVTGLGATVAAARAAAYEGIELIECEGTRFRSDVALAAAAANAPAP